MTKTVAEKMGLKNGFRSILIGAPKEIHEAISFPEIEMKNNIQGEFDYIHFFVTDKESLKEKFLKLKSHLKPTGMLWISWPKNKQLGTDLNIKNVISIGYDFGLVESTCLSINSTWSGLKFTHPKIGKVYNNSYGKLKL